MKQGIQLLLCMILTALAAPSAEAGSKVISGVPNYDQDLFPVDQNNMVERGDCTPVACTMVHGYLDAKGWPRLIPYGSNQQENNAWGIDTVVRRYKKNLSYDPTNGTVFSHSLDSPIKGAIEAVTCDCDPKATFNIVPYAAPTWDQIKVHANGDNVAFLDIRPYVDNFLTVFKSYKLEGESTSKLLPEGHSVCVVGWSDEGANWVICNMGWGSAKRGWFNHDGPGDWYNASVSPGGQASAEDDDAYEDNDTIDFARKVGPGTIGNLRCLDTLLRNIEWRDRRGDWFRFTALAGQTWTVGINFVHAQGDLDLRVFDPSKNAVGTSCGTTGFESVVISPTTAGDYYVFVYGAGGTQNANYSLSVKFAPAAPTGVDASDGTFLDKVRVSWIGAIGATGYEVWRSTANNSAAATLIGSSAASPYDDTSAFPGTTYYYWIKARNAAGASPFSQWNVGFRQLSAPILVEATSTRYQGIYVSFPGGSAGATGYEIWRSPSNDLAQAAQVGVTSSTLYDDTSAPHGAYSWYWVRAKNQVCTSAFSNSQPGFRLVPPPDAPTAVAASDGKFEDKVVVSWGSSARAVWYEIYRGETSTTAASAYVGKSSSLLYEDKSVPEPDRKYYYWVKAVNGTGPSPFSTSFAVGCRQYVKPAPPKDVMASDGTNPGTIWITWNPSDPSVTWYEVWRSTSDNLNSAARVSASTKSPYGDSSGIPGTTYYYWVRAVTIQTTGIFSSSDSGYSLVPVPPVPTGVTATDGIFTDRVQVAWMGATAATSYEVWRSTSNSSAQAIKVGDSASSPYNDASAGAGTKYFYWVKARNAGGTSSFSGPDEGYRQVAAPPAPTGVAATDGTYTAAVRVTWLGSPGASAYEIWRSTNNNSASAAKVGDAAASPYDDRSAVAGTTYFYWVKAKNAGGASGFSVPDGGYWQVPAPPAPTGVSATDGTFAGAVRITWIGSPGGTAYEVWRSKGNDVASAVKLGDSVATLFDDSSAVAETLYYYWIKAKNAGGVSGFSGSDYGHWLLAPPAAPGSVAASDGTFTDRVRVTWTGSAGATAYEVWRSTSNNSASAAKVGDSGASPYDDMSAGSGGTWFYWIKAKNAGGASVFSNSDSGYRSKGLGGGSIREVGVVDTGDSPTSPSPEIGIALRGGDIVLSWPTNDAALRLVYATGLPAATWISNVSAPMIVNGRYSITHSLTNGSRFYRLER